jgi:cysteine desulfurase
MEAYLDNSATTKCSNKAVEKMNKVLLEDFGNPSSMHMKGFEAENYLKNTRSIVAKSLKVNEKEIIFTSGGTETNNLAIIGCATAYKRSGMHVITTPIEHPSVGNAFGLLETLGYDITYLHVDEKGRIDLKELSDEIRPDTILVSIMHVNNEIGTIEPIVEAGNIIKQKNSNTLFHVDAVQSYGKVEIFPKKMNIDLLSVSGHKIHGPKGSGFLYKSEKVKLNPVIFGGGQEWGLRSGTENVPAIAGLGVAVEEIFKNFDKNQQKLYKLREYLITELSKIDGVSLNGPLDETGAPHILSMSVEGVRAEVLLHALEERHIYVSAGSACSSNKPAVSKTLTAIGLNKNLLDSTIRFSFSIHTTKEELEYAVKELKEIIPKLQKYTRH